MPRFHFNIFDGYSLPDHEGNEMVDWSAARLEAVRMAGKTITDQAERITPGRDWHMEVTDEKGLILFRLEFSLTESPMAMKTL